jgi:hypothetical protein
MFLIDEHPYECLAGGGRLEPTDDGEGVRP